MPDEYLFSRYISSKTCLVPFLAYEENAIMYVRQRVTILRRLFSRIDRERKVDYLKFASLQNRLTF